MLENAGKTRAITFLCGGGGMKLNLDPHSPNLVSVVSWLLHHSLGCFWICTVQGPHCETSLVCSGPFEGSCSQCSAVSGPCGRPATSEIVSHTVQLAALLSHQTSRIQLPGIKPFASLSTCRDFSFLQFNSF